MSTTIGRVTLDDLAEWTMDGDEITTSGDVVASSSYAAKALRAQLLGLYANPDEPVVPVTSSDDSDIDGFYWVTSVSVPFTSTSLATNTFSYSITLRRVPNYSRPMFENICIGGFRSNNQGIAAGSMQAVAAIPYYAESFYDLDDVFVGVTADGTRDTATGDLDIYLYTAGGPQRKIHQFSIPPAYWYYGACLIEEKRNGTWYTLVGRQWANAAMENGWRISNGLVRVTANATEPRIDVEMYNGTAWTTAKTYKFSADTPFNEYAAFGSMTVLRNGPEECAIRLLTGVQDEHCHITIDLRIRRGEWMVEGYLTDLSGDTNDLGAVGRATNEASSDMSVGGQVFGVKATAADADSLKFMIFSPRTVTRENVIGRINLTTPNSTFPFAISGEFSGAGINDTYDQIVKQYLAGYTERYSLAGR